MTGMCLKRICPICEAENEIEANFCGGCGEKLKDFCDCWVKKEPYNCGQNLCPGYGLFLLEEIKTQIDFNKEVST